MRKSPKKRSSFLSPLFAWVAKSRRNTALMFVLLFAFVGALVLFATYAATSYSFEAETGTRNECATVVADTAASGGKAVKFECSSGSTTAGFVHPGVVYTQADIDSWSTSSPEYTRLASTGAGSLTTTSTRYKPIVYGDQINSGGDPRCTGCDLNDGLKDQSGFAKVQAVLWAADGNNARRDKVISYLKEFGTVKSIEFDSIRQYKLVAGWGCTNLAQAAEIVDYRDPAFQSFLKNVCYPLLEWTNGSNWHASFADSRLAIAAYVGDEALWTDAKAYYYERIKQSIYHAKYDGNKVFPLHKEDTGDAARLHAPPGTNNVGMTQLHWGKSHDPSGVGQVNTDLTLNQKYPVVNGMNAERLRDLGHVSMGMGGWMHGARTILAQGEELEQHAYDRLLEGFRYHAGRVLTYAQTGTFSAPAPVNGDGGGSRFQAYYGAKQLFGSATPSTVLEMLKRSEVTGYAPAGANHMVAEAFADGTGGSGTNTSPTEGIVTGQINAPSSANYTVWVRMRAADSTNNAVRVELGDQTFTAGNSTIATTGWTWVNYQNGSLSSRMVVALASGDHNLTLTGIEPGVLVDRVLILNGACSPTGNGDNCLNTPPSVSLSSPTNNTSYTAPASVTVTANANDTDGTITKVEFFNGSTKLYEDTTAPYSYSWQNIAAGSYGLTARVTDNSGATAVSQLVSITVNPAPTPEPDNTPIPAPLNFRSIDQSENSVTVAWNKPNDPRVDAYNIRYIAANDPNVGTYSEWTYVFTCDTSSKIEGLEKGTLYYFQVRSRDGNGTCYDTSDDTLGLYTQTLEVKTKGGGNWRKWWR